MKDKKVKKAVYDWLAKIYSTDSNLIIDLLECQMATTYLLIWPVMEQNLFSGFMKHECIESTANRYAPYYEDLSIEEDVKYFHERYQNGRIYRNLKHGNYKTEIDSIINKNYDMLTKKEKLQLMLFVVYRYRNNIFHGSKGLNSWLQYSNQIEKCISFMMKIVDCHEKNFSS